MKIINKKNKKIIAGNVVECKSFFSKGWGLMFSRQPRPLLFDFKKEKIIPLHMLFVFFSIDVLFLDNNKKIVEIKENFRPFMFYTPKKKAQFVIELEQGTIKKRKMQKGDVLSF